MNLETISSENLNKELAYLLGVYLTDGSIVNGKFLLQVIDEEFANFTLNCIKKIIPSCRASIFIRKNSGKWSDKKRYCVSAGFTKFKYLFEQQTNKKHHIPYFIWDASLDIKRWFIAGIMDGDGYVCYHTRPNKNKQWTIGIGKTELGWIYEFKELLESFGISVNKPYRSLTKNNVPFVRFNIRPSDFISHGLFFTIKRKQDRIKLLRNVQRLDAAHPTG